MSDRQDQGASLRDRAGGPSDLGQSSLSQPKALIPCAGDYAVVKGWNSYNAEEIVKVTPKLVKTKGWGSPRQRRISELEAVLADKDAAEELAQALSGALGQTNQRVRKAREEYEARKGAAYEAFDKVAARLIAKATAA